jgi:hypothetical protein
METNDSVTELERIRLSEQQCSVENHNVWQEKTQEVTRSTVVDEFRVNF